MPDTTTPRGLTPLRRRAANIAASHLMLNLRASLQVSLVDTGVMHGPELPHHGTPQEDRGGHRIVNCELRDATGRLCGAVVSGLPHDWHISGCPRYADARATAFDF